MKTAIALLFAASLVTTACASGGRKPDPLDLDATTLVVDNQSLLDMTIYVLRGSQRVRLGTATGLSKTRLTIPQSVVRAAMTLRFIADPVGSNRLPVSEEVSVSESDEIGIRIPPV